MDEILAYTEYQPGTTNGFSFPLVAICDFNAGELSYREFLREDLTRIPDDFSVPGGWVFIKGINLLKFQLFLIILFRTPSLS